MANNSPQLDPKIFNDPIHGLIELHPLLVRIIDTPEFQRLRYIKQLGMCYLVYPGASHNRFEHSIGVCHLAGKFVEELRRKQGNLKIDDKDVLCVKIAGLCHDLGHGPISHMFDATVVSHALEDVNDKKGFQCHEMRSKLILEHLIKTNGLTTMFKDFGLDDDERNFIGDLITDTVKKEERPDGRISSRGKEPEKQFLFEIVANNTNGIDVDKWDYFARDCHMLGIKNNFDYMRCMKLARAIEIEENGEKAWRICFRDKEKFNLYEMFHTRYSLHTRAYQHHTNKIIEHMLGKALIKAAAFLKFGKDNKTISKIIRDGDCDGFCLLTDEILSMIWNSTESNLEEAKAIVEKIKKRELYKLICQTRVLKQHENQKTNSDQGVRAKNISMTADQIKKAVDIREDLYGDIDVLFSKMDYGKKEENPVDSVWFYEKKDQDKAFKIPKEDISYMLPEHFFEKHVLLCCKRDLGDEKFEIAYKFNSWFEKEKNKPPPENSQ